MTQGAEIEIFDPSGTSGRAKISAISSTSVSIEIEKLNPLRTGHPKITVAAAIPKGTRADWMIEKLSELGVDRFIPLAADRSVVLPKGDAKPQRWQRLAEESARQSGRTGVMQIDSLAELTTILDQAQIENTATWYLSPAGGTTPIFDLARAIPPSLLLLIGPEGGWTQTEITAFNAAKIPAVRITQTILRVETAAVAAATVILAALTLGPSAATIPAEATRKSS
jgi:16S rRNA (uracil1498-N3)-methyltransferase